ncbi:hypothetical protein ATANTOWER_026557, partial [Ataeniobius toweri]|nr:hypothetical protein [Ataeniobius toweri]
KPTMTPPPTSTCPPPTSTCPTLGQVDLQTTLLAAMIIFFLVLILLILVLWVKQSACRKSEAEGRTGGEKDITYSDLKILNNQQQPIRSSRERDAASVYSAVRTEDISYGQIIIREDGDKQRIR